MPLQRVKTGIRGLDEMLKGGIPLSHHVLVAGGPGTGKTTFCMEFLYRGAKMGEKGGFISLEERPERIIENTKATFPSWGKDLDEMIEKKKLLFTKAEKWNFENLVDVVQSFVDHQGVRRIVLDSSTLLKMYFPTELEFRRKVYELMDFMSHIEATLLMTCELPTSDRKNMRSGTEQFLADGLIVLYNLEKAEKRVRAVEILKMRGTDHSRELAPMRFAQEGIEIFEGEKVY